MYVLLLYVDLQADRLYEACCSETRDILCLYGTRDGEWYVAPFAESIPPNEPEPCPGINFSKDSMDRDAWLLAVALHSDAWLVSRVGFYGAFLDDDSRKNLFCKINDTQTCYQCVRECLNGNSVSPACKLLSSHLKEKDVMMEKENDAAFSENGTGTPMKPAGDLVHCEMSSPNQLHFKDSPRNGLKKEVETLINTAGKQTCPTGIRRENKRLGSGSPRKRRPLQKASKSEPIDKADSNVNSKKPICSDTIMQMPINKQNLAASYDKLVSLTDVVDVISEKNNSPGPAKKRPKQKIDKQEIKVEPDMANVTSQEKKKANLKDGNEKCETTENVLHAIESPRRRSSKSKSIVISPRSIDAPNEMSCERTSRTGPFAATIGTDVSFDAKLDTFLLPKKKKKCSIRRESMKSQQKFQDKCPNCGKVYKIGEFWVQCDVCDAWYDGKCTGITPEEQIILETSPYETWKCPLCT